MTEECCVCRGTHSEHDNKLVSCNGQGCKVTVHQACYGITSLSSSGMWYCCKCVSQERAAKVKCELCPKRDGAYKRTDSGGWAHVVCALYIPEVSFGNTTTMEPIITSHVPRDRLTKTCYICEERGLEAFAAVGACMPCHKQSCRLQFHVTCGQKTGLLCEEEDPQDPSCLVYCGYCEPHWRKLKGRRESGATVRSSRGASSRARSTSFDAPGPSGASGTGQGGSVHSTPSGVKTEAVEPVSKPVKHPTVKRRARGRKLSSSSEGSEASEVPPSHLACGKGADEGETTDKPTAQQYQTITEEPSPLPRESGGAPLLSMDESTLDDLAVNQTDGATDGEVAPTNAKPPSPSAAETEEKSSNSSSDSSSEDSSSSDNDASDAMDTLHPPIKEEEEDMDNTSIVVAASQPSFPSISSVASPASNAMPEEGAATNTEGKQTMAAEKGTSKELKEQKDTSSHTSVTSPTSTVKRRVQATPAVKGRGGAVVRGGRGSRPVRSNGVQRNGSPARRRVRPKSVKVPSPEPNPSLPPPTTLEELLKRQWEETMTFLTQDATRQHSNAASVLAELVSLQEENRRMEQKIIELSSQREFYRANNSRLQSILEKNSVTAFVNGSNPTGGHFKIIAGNNPPVAGLSLVPAHSSGQELQEKWQQGGRGASSASLGQADISGMNLVGPVPQQASDAPPPTSDAQMVWTSASSGGSRSGTRWTLSGWKQGAFEPQSGLTPLVDVPNTSA